MSVNRELAFLRPLYNKAIDWEKVTTNPVKTVKFDREDNNRIRWLSTEEAARLLAQCAPQLTPLVITALHTGFRASELLSTWGDVDFQRGIITVRAVYAKNGESRSVPMNKVLTATLKAIRINSPTTDRVFRNRKKRPTAPSEPCLSGRSGGRIFRISPFTICGTPLPVAW